MSVTGNRGKFSDRLKKIIWRRKKRNIINDNNLKLEDSQKIYMNFVKVVAAIPMVVYGTVKDNSKTKENDRLLNNEINYGLQNDINNYQKIKQNNRRLIKNIDVASIKKEHRTVSKEIDKNVVNDNKIKELEKSIINLIKKDLIKIVNEMEILQSELYILSEVNGDNKVLKDCQIELDHVKDMICKIDKLKTQYDFLKDNYDFEYLLEIDNNDLVDKIIELRDSFGRDELKTVSEDYKLLEVYRYLYLKIDDLEQKTLEFEAKKKEEEEKLKERDIDFEKLKTDVYNVHYVNREYDSFVRSQNDLLKRIDAEVSKIETREVTNYYLKGFNELFRNSFKYFGLLMISPLKGIVPSIATETLITANVVKNLYHNLSWEKEKHMVYEAMDYSNTIGMAISDLESTNRIVDATLDDIVHLKMEYNEKFRKYQGDFLEYREVMQKISDMENKIIGNKIKIEMMRKKALEQKRINDKKMILVKEMNKKENM